MLLNLDVEKIPEYDEFDSIDDIMDYYSKANERGVNSIKLEPKQEFIGHCSNIQAWVENDYNVNILHSKLSFSLLSALSFYGNSKAKIMLKEEIARRLLSKNKNTILYFLETDYLYLYEIEELEFVFDEIDIEDQFVLKKINKLMNHRRIYDKMKAKGHHVISLEIKG